MSWKFSPGRRSSVGNRCEKPCPGSGWGSCPMALQRRWGFLLLIGLGIAGASYWVALRLGYVEKWQARDFPRPSSSTRISSRDIPAGLAAPVGETASTPPLPHLVGFTPPRAAPRHV